MSSWPGGVDLEESRGGRVGWGACSAGPDGMGRRVARWLGGGAADLMMVGFGGPVGGVEGRCRRHCHSVWI